MKLGMYAKLTNNKIKILKLDSNIFFFCVKCRQCYENSLDETKVKGKIVVCDGIDDYNLAFNKTNTVQKVGGIGIIHITDQDGGDAIYYGDFPSTEVIPKDAATILQYINSTR